jgi:mannose/fructose/N-acetylgalactosamine-specific phosphotransferase system component IIC
MVENILIALFGSLIVLDTTVIFQFLLSQPLITCTIIGWFFGDIQLGLQIGFYLQLLWLSSIPVGAAIVPEGNVAAIITATLVLRYHFEYQYLNVALVAGVFYGLMISFVGGQLVVVYRKINVKLLDNVLSHIDRGQIGVLNRVPFVSISMHYIMMFFLIMITLSLGDLVFPSIRRVPVIWDSYCRYGVIGILGIGAGMVITLYEQKKANRYLAVGLLLGAIIFYIL